MLTTPQLDQLASLIQLTSAWSSLTDAQVAAEPGLSAPVITESPFYVNHRTMLDVCNGVNATTGNDAAEWVAATIQSQMPATYQIYVTPGPNDGTGGGLDVSNPATQTFLNDLVALSAEAASPNTGIFTQAMATAAIALCQTSTYTVGAAVATSDVTAARAIVAGWALAAKANAGLGAAMTLINTAINNNTALPTGTQLQQAFAAQVGN